MISRIISTCLIAILGFAASTERASARGFIRDTEIEAILSAYATPIFHAAGLDPSSVQMYIVRDNSLNAFVAGGQRMFINTGTLEKASTPEELIGVMAHEAGHIAGGHLSRTQQQLEKASALNIITTIVGLAAGVAAKRGDVASAAILGGQGLGTSTFLSYSRTQESSADQAGLRFLDRAGITAQGMLDFMRLLEDQELLSVQRQDPYLRTHPFARERVDAIEAHLAASPFTGKPLPAEFEVAHKRMQAKLYAFQNSLGRTLRKYPLSDTSLEARYARAIGYYRRPDLDKALAEIDGLLAESPEDPYFNELKGQMLFENGRVDEALPSLTKASQLVPTAPLIRVMLAHAQIESGDPELLRPAQQNLAAALVKERRNAATWRFLAIAYGRDGQEAYASYAQAELSLLKGDRRAALFHACQAFKKLKPGEVGWIRVQDILEAVEPSNNAPDHRGGGRPGPKNEEPLRSRCQE